MIVSALAAAGSGALAASAAPLADVIRAGRFAGLAPVVRIGAAIASLGVLLSLIAGVSRTMFAMAATGDLPRQLAAVHPTHRTPHRAELTAGAIVVLLVAFLDVGQAIGFSSFAVLVYYAVANAAALTLSRAGAALAEAAGGARAWPAAPSSPPACRRPRSPEARSSSAPVSRYSPSSARREHVDAELLQ